jgi:hypothetical protein
MTTDATQLLRDHWSEVPKADEETVRRAFAYATSGTRTRFARPLRHRGVHPLRLRIALPAVAAICAAAAAVVATGTFTGGASQTARPVFRLTVTSLSAGWMSTISGAAVR